MEKLTFIMTMRNKLTVLLFAMMPIEAGAHDFDGVYEYGFCDTPPFVALEIAGADVRYYDTPCTLTDETPLSESDGALQFTLSCDHGSGPTPQTVILFNDADGNLLLRSEGTEDKFVSCIKE